MKLKLGKFFDGTPTHRFTPAPEPPQRGHEMVTSAVIPPRPETAPKPPPIASGAGWKQANTSTPSIIIPRLPEPPVPAPVNCTAVTSRGTRCKLPRGTDSDKCAIHQPKATT